MTSDSVFTGNPFLEHWIMLERSQGAIMIDHLMRDVPALQGYTIARAH